MLWLTMALSLSVLGKISIRHNTVHFLLANSYKSDVTILWFNSAHKGKPYITTQSTEDRSHHPIHPCLALKTRHPCTRNHAESRFTFVSQQHILLKYTYVALSK